MQTAQAAPPTTAANAQVDAARLQQFQRKMREEQDLSRGIMAGLGGAILGACLWALVTVLTQYQIGWMAVGVGFLVGYAIRTFGRGVDKVFGYTGAALALLGCLLGNLLSVCIMLGNQTDTSSLTILTSLDLASVKELMLATFQPMDLLFYGLALYEGYKFSFRKLSDKEVRSLVS
jgi:hypothetical protein